MGKGQNLNKSELIATVAVKLDVSKAEAGRTIESVIGTIIEGATAGECTIPGLGKLVLSTKAARSGVSRLQGTDKAWSTEESKVIKLRLSSAGKKLGN